MRRSWLLLGCSVAMLMAAGGAVSTAAAQSGTIRCESRGSERDQCAIERGAQVRLVRQLSDRPCRENSTWGVGPGYIWVFGGCRGEFAVNAIGAYPPGGPGYVHATPMQLRACRSEADRRNPGYSYDQVQVEAYQREGSTAWVRWTAGNTSGTCTVASSGRIIEFTTDGYGGGGPGEGATRITCESRSTGRQECPIPSGTQIRLLRQLSQNPCRLNDTYGRGAGYIWVAEGCRAEFEVVRTGYPGGGGGPGGTTQVTCESASLNRQVCPIPSGSSARLVRQLSDSPCRLNSTYGFDRGTIWVANGCRGLFEVTRYGGPGGGSNVTRITCSSNSAARQQCGVQGASRVALVRQVSSSPCTLNQSYGIGVNHIWVSNGCRGEFDVTVGGPGGGTVPGLPQPAERVTCESRGNDRVECRVRTGAAVELVRQLSGAPCIRERTWGAGYGRIWVQNGCRGEFEVR
jgi:hypothetical protein